MRQRAQHAVGAQRGGRSGVRIEYHCQGGGAIGYRRVATVACRVGRGAGAVRHRQPCQHRQRRIGSAQQPHGQGRCRIARGQPGIGFQKLMGDVVRRALMHGAIRGQRVACQRAADLEAGRHQDAVADRRGGPQGTPRAERVMACRRQRGGGKHPAKRAQPRDFLGQPGAAKVPPWQRAEGGVEAGGRQVIQLRRRQSGRPRQEARCTARLCRHGIAAQRAGQRGPMPAGHACRRTAAEPCRARRPGLA
ncbi:hypothetical protein D9M72_274790 [compost metagenome]